MLVSVGFSIVGALFPPLMALRNKTMRLFWVMFIVQIVLLILFFNVFWGPSLIAHVCVWLLGLVTALPRQTALKLNRVLGG